jgi:hypothetical protein
LEGTLNSQLSLHEKRGDIKAIESERELTLILWMKFIVLA